MEIISILIHCYNEEYYLMEAYEKLTNTLKKMGLSYELLFIDNHSSDLTFTLLKRLVEQDYACRFISLHHTLSMQDVAYIGLSKSSGNYIAFWDCELPACIFIQMYEEMRLQQQCYILHDSKISKQIQMPYFLITKDIKE